MVPIHQTEGTDNNILGTQGNLKILWVLKELPTWHKKVTFLFMNRLISSSAMLYASLKFSKPSPSSLDIEIMVFVESGRLGLFILMPESVIPFNVRIAHLLEVYLLAIRLFESMKFATIIIIKHRNASSKMSCKILVMIRRTKAVAGSHNPRQ